MDHHINWVQALPRALSIHHDMVGEGTLSPYQIMFGRDRNVQGIPYTPERICEDAQAFFHRMDTIDKLVATALQEKHIQTFARRNASLPHRESYSPGDLVWLYRAPSLSTQSKLEPLWRGPLLVKVRVGEHSYELQDKLGHITKAHVDNLKPYRALGETGELTGLNPPPLPPNNPAFL
jgi:hypothetical protein